MPTFAERKKKWTIEVDGQTVALDVKPPSPKGTKKAKAPKSPKKPPKSKSQAKKQAPETPQKSPHSPKKSPKKSKSNSKVKKQSLNDVPPASPTSAVFHEISEVQGRPSILAFRQHCTFKFPHPIYLHTQEGIKIPRVSMTSNLRRSDAFSTYLKAMCLCDELPRDTTNCMIVYLDENEEHFLSGRNIVYPSSSTCYVLKENTYPKILVGTKGFFKSKNDTSGHAIFFEAHLATMRVRIVDPNGYFEEFVPTYQKYFDKWTMVITRVHNININEETVSPHTHRMLTSLGLTSNEDDGGKCATISMFYVFDYMCTRQWEHTLALEEPGSLLQCVDRGYRRDHFFRSSRDWVYSNDELSLKRAAPIAIQVRLVLIARYIAFHLTKHFRRRLKHIKIEPPDEKDMVTICALPSTFDGEKMTSYYRVRDHNGKTMETRLTEKTRSLKGFFAGAESAGKIVKKLNFD